MRRYTQGVTGWQTWFRDPPPTRSERPPGNLILVYDDECGFCTNAALWIQRRARRPLRLVGFSALDPGAGYLGGLSRREFEASAHLVTPSGREYHGGEAITKALRLWRWGWLVRPLDCLGGRMVRAAGYRSIARNRGGLSRLAKRLRADRSACN